MQGAHIVQSYILEHVCYPTQSKSQWVVNIYATQSPQLVRAWAHGTSHIDTCYPQPPMQVSILGFQTHLHLIQSVHMRIYGCKFRNFGYVAKLRHFGRKKHSRGLCKSLCEPWVIKKAEPTEKDTGSTLPHSLASWYNTNSKLNKTRRECNHIDRLYCLWSDDGDVA